MFFLSEVVYKGANYPTYHKPRRQKFRFFTSVYCILWTIIGYCKLVALFHPFQRFLLSRLRLPSLQPVCHESLAGRRGVGGLLVPLRQLFLTLFDFLVQVHRLVPDVSHVPENRG